MVNDVFVEQIVRRKNTPQRMLAKAGIVIGAVVVALALVFFSGLLGEFAMFGTMAAIGALYGGYYLLTGMNVEYEYIVTNGEMDVDSIIAQRKRKRLLTVSFRDAEAFGRYNAQEHEGKTYGTRLFACDSPDSQNLWYVTARVKDKGQVLLVFNGFDRVLEAIKPFLPRPLFHQAFNRVQG